MYRIYKVFNMSRGLTKSYDSEIMQHFKLFLVCHVIKQD